MAGLETTGSNPDVSLLYDINGLARDAPPWVDHTVTFLGQYGLLLGMVVLTAACWWTERRRAASLDTAAAATAAVLWVPLAAVLAVLVNIPIRGFVRRPRPFADHDGLDVLIHGERGFSFVSDHATLAMAMAAGLFVASRRFGLTGIVLALAEGFCRIYAGVQYPTDVIGGFALGTAVALLLSPVAAVTLTPLVKAVGGTARAGRLVWPQHTTGGDGTRGLRLQESPGRKHPGQADTDRTGPTGGPHLPPASARSRDPRDPHEPDLAA